MSTITITMKRKGTMRRRRVKRGGSLFGWLKKANSFLRKHKILSTGASLFAKTGLPYASQIGTAGRVAGQLGYGTTPTGGRYRRQGGSLRLAGAGRRRRCR
jgi:hypothetical protein